MDPNADRDVYVMGYSNELSVRQGGELEIKVSTTEPEFRADIIRFDRYFQQPDPARDTIIESPVSGQYPGRLQPIAIGSYITVPSVDTIAFPAGFTFQCWIQPGIIQHTHAQGIAGRWDHKTGRGFGLSLSPEGRLVVEIANGDDSSRVEDTETLVAGRWYFVAVRVDTHARSLDLLVVECKRRWLSSRQWQSTATTRMETLPDAGSSCSGHARSFPGNAG